MANKKEGSRWQPVKDFMGDSSVLIGSHHAYHFYNSPRKILHMMSYYKFASKVIGPGTSVLDIGCGEGLGTWLLAVECGKAKGVDLDKDAIDVAKTNWKGKKICFSCEDFLDVEGKEYDAVVSFDVIEHILPENVEAFWGNISKNLKTHGIAVVGTLNVTTEKYSSAITKLGHVNLYSGERLEDEMRKYFKHVFMFAANDEVVHTGYLPMAHYLFAVGCHKI